MVKQIPSSDQSDPPKVGPSADYLALLNAVAEKKTRLAGIYEVYMAACVIWNREKAMLEEMEDKLYSIQQGQMNL